MKIYDKMEKHEIIELLHNNSCNSCAVKHCTHEYWDAKDHDLLCMRNKIEYIDMEVKMVPRCHKIRTIGEMSEVHEEFRKNVCRGLCCDECKYNMIFDSVTCFDAYLMEEVEDE